MTSVKNLACRFINPSHALGLLFLLSVTFLWSLVSVLVQRIYSNPGFSSPFLLTYVCTSLFVLFIPSRLIVDHVNKVGYCGKGKRSIIPWDSNDVPSCRRDTLSSCELGELSDDLISDKRKQTAITNVQDDDDDDDEGTNSSTEPHLLGHLQHMRIAMWISPLWFISNFAYNSSLFYTSITSSTVLAQTSSLFTFIFAVLSGDESFTAMKCWGVLLCLFGGLFTSMGDLGNTEMGKGEGTAFGNNKVVEEEGRADINASNVNGVSTDMRIFGDFISLLSAVSFGAYTVLIQMKCPKDESRISMPLIFGYSGLFNTIMFSPLVVTSIVFTKSSIDLSNLTYGFFGLMVAVGFLNNVLSDYLWARAVILTNATVASVGLSLTIPLAFLCDGITGRGDASWNAILGAIMVFVGFVFVQTGQKDKIHDH